MTRDTPTTTVEHEGETYTFSYDAIIECEHCDHTWASSSRSRRPTCTACGYKTDRNLIAAEYRYYIKSLLVNGTALKKQAIRDAGGIPEDEVSDHRILDDDEQENVMSLREADVSTEAWLDYATGALRRKANQWEAMVANGWEITDIQDHRVFMRKDDFEEPDDAIKN